MKLCYLYILVERLSTSLIKNIGKTNKDIKLNSNHI